MASKGYFKPATIADAKWLAPRLRKEDRRECLTVCGKPPEDILPGSVALATASYTMFTPEGVPAGLFGCSKTASEGVGAVWLLATDVLPQHAKEFLRQSKVGMELLHTHYPTLWNIVDTRNTVHLRWINWVGFTFGPIRHIGHDRVPFLEFSRTI